jgi:hypothetical protein
MTVRILGQRRKLATGMDAIQIHGFPGRAGPVELIPELMQSMTASGGQRSPVIANITRFDEPACHSLMSA